MNHHPGLPRLLSALLVTIALPARAADSVGTEAQVSYLLPMLVILLVLGLAGIGYWLYQQHPGTEPTAQAEDPFCESRITETFISALPSLSPELNLEIAKTWQMESLEKSDTQRLLGINFGTNTAQIKMPVTYRYHVRLQDPWTLNVRAKSVHVYAPTIRPSQPPAIHTEQMNVESKRGWGRLPPYELVDQLQHQLTPILSRYAEDPRRLQFIRETARLSVAQFVRLWLERESRWNRSRFTSIHVQFRDEKAAPAAPTLQLLCDAD